MTTLADRRATGGEIPSREVLGPIVTTGIDADTLRRSLNLLLKAHAYARDVQHSTWDFAVEITQLRDSGLSECDLRWLVCKGYVEHAVENTLPAEQDGRSFRPLTSLKFGDESCFVLTDAGVIFAENVDRQFRLSLSNIRLDHGNVGACCRPKSLAIPIWDPIHRELRVGNHVVKRYRVPAPNQEVVLAAFEEENWPARIDDPIAPAAEIDPKRRLHATIQCLNRYHRRRLIHFCGDGHGTGVGWERVR